ncbi:DsrE family protein [Thiothrix nivea]|uniref:DsrE family protein n=1 Tax=Thiothrix nivea (strain ATCC 35100 / DSM 5205 / JP2) TaxID=870187 RepID=A0A656HEB9_THINJ|nr:DsrE family protein [Thiothrix nivea]EIJ33760.1 hypothetical protein Thini_1141 [Thiothrix nivea DSM 5205]
MKIRLKLLMYSIVVAASLCSSTFTYAADETQGVLALVTSPEPQTQMMAMVLATQSLTKGKKVQIVLCSGGGDLVLKNSEEVLFEPLKKSPQMLLKNLIKEGANVQVCPLYLPSKGATQNDMIEGVTMAKPSEVTDTLLQPDIKVLNF